MSDRVIEPGAAFVIDGEAPTAAPARSKAPSYKKLALAGLGLLAALGAARYGDYWWAAGRFIESTDDAYVGGNVTVIAPQVAGFIATVNVTDNQKVRAGDLLVKIDDRVYRTALAKAIAAVAGEKATIADLDATRRLRQAEIKEAEAEVAASDAEIARAGDDAARYRQLSVHGNASIQTFEKADADNKKAIAAGERSRASLEAARRQLDVVDAQRQEAEAGLAGAIADRDMAELNIGYTEVRSPVDGTVGNRSARTGAYATIGAQIMSIVPSKGLWVDANFKENQLAAMRPGQPATITADVLPGETFRGHVVSLAPATGAEFSILPAENATGNFTKIVQRVPVRIALDGDGSILGRLRPGLSVTADIDQRPSGTP